MSEKVYRTELTPISFLRLGLVGVCTAALLFLSACAGEEDDEDEGGDDD